MEISRLMDEYTDNEFFPEGGAAADLEAVKRIVLERAVPAKRRRPSVKMALLAAVLTAVCVLMAAATTGGPVVRYLSGAIFENGIFDGTKAVSPVLLEDGRIWFVGDGQHTDITGLIDENTPYIYVHTDPETMAATYTVVGGTADDFGWFEYAFWYGDEGNAEGGTVGGNYYTEYVSWDHATYIPLDELTPEQEELIQELGRTEGGWPVRFVYRPWVIAANDELAGIDLFH